MQTAKSVVKNRRHISPFEIFLYIFFGLLAVITIYPFYNVFIVSLSNTIANATHTPYLYPHVMDLTGYKTIINDPYFFKSLRTTLFVTIVGTALNMLFSVTAAYVLSKKRLVGRNIILSVILFTMLFSGGMIPTYLVVSGLGLTNSIWSMILPCLINTYYLIIMKNYFASLPPSLEEAARIDGANEFVVLTRIYIPISAPFMATFALFYAVERWNEWWNAFLYINDKSIKPLQIYLRDVLVNFNSQLATQAQSIMSSQGKVFVQSIQMATIIITMLPIVCVYPFVQKYFVKGVMVGSVKE
ncbi:carbohydrate ABC transporter membrane protein 2 (CUT1 family) [Hydrogenoanaerobacterium saccharovorans]|uniref:Carbohydrate ABC transporter membrane protein 2, CUT1 family n=1 Tax=Hydrogenoanaerobacterium saccharovorans TaxID=474960 RepID=A0A1H8B043_9FIRM|nr:carbohydrate ABC transporter permease [Hydrogenoanaerobacterium saccharovorans]RPF47688.1 carbohydrate ABC transporter membrane protein 2 (CUT1 family) [Hydrogenoanaerobacterium saccharovorans]SEM75529.1 carbohydrate ABC transporter membrane protein 2, CUT1 family [Hydrogenoanaerobacterium saccharovorans]